ncbi:MAG: histidine phosphatase family protein [Gemmatimonadales bacterium]|nr:histidine phosphatase family protein [Gemmatimonadales bacterium]
MTSLLPALLLALAPQAPADTVQPPTVVVVRHAEKADAPRDLPLSEAGRARALALDSAPRRRPGDCGRHFPYRRNAETAALVAARHGLTITQSWSCVGGVTLTRRAVAAEAMRNGGTVLVGSQQYVGAIVAGPRRQRRCRRLRALTSGCSWSDGSTGRCRDDGSGLRRRRSARGRGCGGMSPR